MKRAFQKHLDGMAAVFAVCELLARNGHVPFIPSHDYGIDLMIGNGIRIQVKSAKCWRRLTASAIGYQFDMRKSTVWRDGRKLSHSEAADEYKEICDFMILVAVDERRFFIVPTAEIKSPCIWIPKRGDFGTARKYRKDRWLLEFEDAWQLLDVDNTLSTLESESDDVTEKETLLI